MNLIKRIFSLFIGGYKTDNHIKIFKNTLFWIRNDHYLREGVNSSIKNQVLIKETDYIIKEKKTRPQKQAQVFVTKDSTIEAAMKYHQKKICVLNFASAINPGGGVLISKTPSGQEECLCRATTLYSCLNDCKMINEFYIQNRTIGNNLHKDDIIFTPNVIVFKNDDNLLLKRDDWFTIDVVTCAAPNVGKYQKGEASTIMIDENTLKDIHKKRARRILDVAASHREDVIILGAFGCGAFNNPPALVAEVYRSIIPEYENLFETIEFAIYSRTNDSNYQTFNKIIINDNVAEEI